MIISVIFIVATTIICAGSLLQEEEVHFKDLLQSASLAGAVDLFFGLILWAPYHYRESRYAKGITYTALGLSLLPIIFIFIAIHMMSRVQC
jgi:hypothetical protein